MTETAQAPDDYLASLARKRMAAAVLFTDPRGRLLLVEPTYKDYWEVPGGAVDADESPYDAAVREVKEELGLPVSPGRLLVVDWVPPRPGRTDELAESLRSLRPLPGRADPFLQPAQLRNHDHLGVIRIDVEQGLHVVADLLLGPGETADLGHAHTFDAQLPSAGPTPYAYRISRHCNRLVGRQAIFLIVSATTPGDTFRPCVITTICRTGPQT